MQPLTSPIKIVGSAGLIALSVVAIGALLEGKRWARALEVVRMTTVLTLGLSMF